MTGNAGGDSDQTLMERLRATRDAAAIAEIVRRYGGMVYGVCLRRSEATQAAQVCEQVFRAAIENPAQVKGPLPVWLHAEVLQKIPASAEVACADVNNWAALAPVFDAALGTLRAVERWHILVNLCALPPRGHHLLQAQEFNEPDISLDASLAALCTVLAASPNDQPALRAGIEANAIAMLPPAVSTRLGQLALASLPASAGEALSPALSRARLYLGVSIGIFVLVLVLGGLIYVLSDKAADIAEERKSPAQHEKR
jgi:hypothetical protein